MKKTIFFLLSFALLLGCKKDDPDPCETVTCLNGGTCSNGECNCPEEYTGSDCSQQKTPDRIEVRKITVTQFPSTRDNGSSWDFADGPDIYPVIAIGTDQLTLLRNNFKEDAISGNYSWNLNGVFIDDPTAVHLIGLWDKDDFGDDEYLGGIQFTPYWDNNGFPNPLKLSCSGCNTVWELEVNYIF